MRIKGLQDEDFLQYKKASMFIIFPYCDFKCDRECGMSVCQNSSLAHAKIINIPATEIIERYLQNPITKAIVCGGLEPLDTFDELLELIKTLREDYHCADDVVIYTGYNKDEIIEQIDILSQYDNIIIKFGRYIYNQSPHYDEVLGINLASDNQYGEKLIKK